MEQKLFFYLLSIMCLIILIYQYRNFKTEKFIIQRLDGNVTIEQNAKIIIGKKNTDNDAIVNSSGILHVKERIKIGDKVFDENMLKKLKSYSTIYNMKSERGDKLCLKDANNNQVCCDKVEMGILTGQTPFYLKLTDKKIAYSKNGQQIIPRDIEYPLKRGLRSTTRESIFYDKRFVMFPYNMEELTDEARGLKAQINSTSTGDLIGDLILSTQKFLLTARTHGTVMPSDTLMLKVPGIGYFCNIENKSPKVTLNRYEYDEQINTVN